MDEIKRELKIREDIYNIYNKTEEDFGAPAALDKEAWDAYLEEREDIIDSLIERVDEVATKGRIQEYQRQNKDNIAANRRKKLQAAGKLTAAETVRAHDAPSQAAAAAYVPGGGYMPPGVTVMQPMPLRRVEEDKDGFLQPLKRVELMSAEARQQMAAASGWTQELVRQRTLQAAFKALFVN